MKKLLVVLLAGVATAAAQDPVVSKPALDLAEIRRLPVLEGERYKPLDSMAREWIEQITGKAKFRSTDPVLLLLHLRFEPEKAREAAIIKLPGYRAAVSVGFEPEAGRDHVSYDELAKAPKMRERLSEIHAKPEKALTESEREILTLQTKWAMTGAFMGLDRRFGGAPHLAGLLPCVPPAEPPQVGVPYSWLSPGEIEHSGHPAGKTAPAAAAFERLRNAFRADDGPAFAAAAKDLASACAALGYPSGEGFGFPGMARLDREIRFNAASPFKSAMWTYCIAWLFALVAAVAFPRSKIVWIASFVPLVGGFAYHAWGMVERTILSGRAMIGNFYESMLFVGGGAALAGLILEAVFRNRWILFSSSALAFSAVWVATHNPDFMRPAISNLAPVLINNDWIHIHVPTIMLSYAILGLSAVLGHVWLFKYLASGGNSESQRSLAKTIFWTIPPGVTLLFAGIILGGVWADASWGRFWGWDPKEVGALIMWLVFMVLIHGRWAGWLRDFGTALGTVVGGWSLAWSYYGTNFFWSGLHSYAAASGGAEIPRWMIWGTLSELAFVAVTVVIWARNRRSAGTDAGSADEAAIGDEAGPGIQVSGRPSPASR